MALLSSLTDTFDTAGAIDGTKWTFTNTGLSGSASYASGRLNFSLDTTTIYNGECHLKTLANYDMTSDGAYVKVVSKNFPALTQMGLRVETSADATDYLDFYWAEDGLLYLLGVNNGGAVWGTTLTYSSTSHAWWRIRENGGTIYFDAAPATASNPPASGDWVNLYSDSLSTLTWSGVKTSVKAHLYYRLVGSGASSTPVAQFDGYNTLSGSSSGINATLTAAEYTASDTFAGNGTVKIAASLAAQGGGSDTFAAVAATTAIRNVTMTLTESGADTFAANAFGGTTRNVTIAITGTGIDTFSATATRGSVGLPPYQPPTDTASFIAWLKKSDSAKCLLIEVDVMDSSGTIFTLYMSSVGYVTFPTDTPPNQLYDSDIIGGCTVTSDISLSYTTDMTIGDVEVSNVNGVHDAWFGYIWKNRPIRYYLGDARWKRADFRLVFSGTCHDIASRDYGKINIVMADKLQQLNQSVSSALLGGTTSNADKLIPLCFGECSNVTPLLIDPVNLIYQVHIGSINDIVEVRDEGVPISFTKDLVHGQFTLLAQPAGRITCTVQGDKYLGFYATTLAQIIKRIVTGFGTAPFSNADIDATSFANYDAAYAQPFGIYLQNRENILDVCNTLASSVASAMTLDGSGKLHLSKIEITADVIAQYINQSHFIAKTFELIDRVDVQPSIKLAYCRNWTPQPGLQSGIPEAHKQLWADEWMTFTGYDSIACSRYGIPTQPTDQVDTYLITTYDAQGEANHRVALWGVQRSIYGFQAFPELILLELGDWINITHDRFGFDAGANGFIIGLEKDWLNCRLSIKVLL